MSILIEEIEQSCEDIVFIGIQPGDTEFYNPMSPEVFDAVDAVYDAVAANDWEACAAYVRGMVDQIQR